MTELTDPTPLSIAQSQIVALQSRQHQLEVKLNDLIHIVKGNYGTEEAQYLLLTELEQKEII